MSMIRNKIDRKCGLLLRIYIRYALNVQQSGQGEGEGFELFCRIEIEIEIIMPHVGFEQGSSRPRHFGVPAKRSNESNEKASVN